jgi:hypothetical protein
MALARVVTFEGVSSDRLKELQQQIESGEPPEGMPPSEIIVLHEPEAEKSTVIILFDSEDDYRKGDEILNSMPSGDTPGQRTSVEKHNVAMRMKS